MDHIDLIQSIAQFIQGIIILVVAAATLYATRRAYRAAKDTDDLYGILTELAAEFRTHNHDQPTVGEIYEEAKDSGPVVTHGHKFTVKE